MKIYLTNPAGVSLSLSNDFVPQLKRELEDMETQELRLKCVNKNSKYGSNWKLEYQSKTKEVYKRIDTYKNIHYLVVKFE